MLRGFKEVMQTAPDELCAVGVMLTTPDGHPAVGIAPAYFGDALGEGERLCEPLRKLGTVVMEQLGPMPYTALQSMLNDSAVPHRRYYMRSNVMNDVSDDAIDVFAESYNRVPSPFTAVVIVSLGGAASRVPGDATTYYHRAAPYTMSVIHCWLDATDDEPNIGWLRELWDNLGPHLAEGVYVNELQDEGPDRIRAAYGPAYDRLAALKRQYGPSNQTESKHPARLVVRRLASAVARSAAVISYSIHSVTGSVVALQCKP